MQVIHYPDPFPTSAPTIATVGAFDGVHLGHRSIFQQLQQEAEQRQLASVIVTFTPHPQQVLHPEENFQVINTAEQKIELLKKESIDYLYIIPFTTDFAAWPPEQFIQQILIGQLHTQALIMGPNHAFGHNRSGTHTSIQDYCHEHHIDIIEIPEVVIHDNAVRSTLIRKHLQAGDYEKAEELLGYKINV